MLRVCARGVRATCRPWRRESTFTAPQVMGARLHHGCASRFASCSAWSGSATRPCPAGPTASRCAPCPSCVTPAQRRTPYAWPSGLLLSRAWPRTTGPPSSAGGIALTATVSQPTPHDTSQPTVLTVPAAAASQQPLAPHLPSTRYRGCAATVAHSAPYGARNRH